MNFNFLYALQMFRLELKLFQVLLSVTVKKCATTFASETLQNSSSLKWNMNVILEHVQYSFLCRPKWESGQPDEENSFQMVFMLAQQCCARFWMCNQIYIACNLKLWSPTLIKQGPAGAVRLRFESLHESWCLICQLAECGSAEKVTTENGLFISLNSFEQRSRKAVWKTLRKRHIKLLQSFRYSKTANPDLHSL